MYILYLYSLKICDLLFCFDFCRGFTIKRLPCISEETLDFEISLRLLWTVGKFGVKLKAFVHYDMATHPWGPGSEM